MEILTNIFADAVLELIKSFRPQKTLDGYVLDKEQLAVITKCIVTITILIICAILIIKLDFAKLALLCFVGFLSNLFYAAVKI